MAYYRCNSSSSGGGVTIDNKEPTSKMNLKSFTANTFTGAITIPNGGSFTTYLKSNDDGSVDTCYVTSNDRSKLYKRNKDFTLTLVKSGLNTAGLWYSSWLCIYKNNIWTVTSSNSKTLISTGYDNVTASFTINSIWSYKDYIYIGGNDGLYKFNGKEFTKLNAVERKTQEIAESNGSLYFVQVIDSSSYYIYKYDITNNTYSGVRYLSYNPSLIYIDNYLYFSYAQNYQRHIEPVSNGSQITNIPSSGNVYWNGGFMDSTYFYPHGGTWYLQV